MSPSSVRLTLGQRDERVLVLWSDQLDNIIPLCRDFEDKLIKLVWRARATLSLPASEIGESVTPSNEDLIERAEDSLPEKIPVMEKEVASPPAPTNWTWFNWRSTREDRDVEKTAPKARPMRLIAPFYSGLGCALSLCRINSIGHLALLTVLSSDFIGSGATMLLQESILDGRWVRFALLATAPFSFCVSLVSRRLHLYVISC